MNAYTCSVYIKSVLWGHLFTVAIDEITARTQFITYISKEFNLLPHEVLDLENPPYPVPGKYAMILHCGGPFVAGEVY